MLKYHRNLILVILVLSLLMPVAAIANRWALVIGNANYQHDKPLANPIRDSQLLHKSLEQIDFSVTSVQNTSQKQMVEALRAFSDKIQSGDVALIYYSGHGLQHNNDNFLIPVDANIARANEISYQAISSSQVLSYLEQASTKILVLDACRNNPFSTGVKDIGKGLGRQDVSKINNTLIAFAAAPNQAAQDGQGNYSPYAKALAQTLVQPGKSVEDVFKSVLKQVREETHSTQAPWYNASLEETIYLAGVVPYVPPESDADRAEITAFSDQISYIN